MKEIALPAEVITAVKPFAQNHRQWQSFKDCVTIRATSGHVELWVTNGAAALIVDVAIDSAKVHEDFQISVPVTALKSVKATGWAAFSVIESGEICIQSQDEKIIVSQGEPMPERAKNVILRAINHPEPSEIGATLDSRYLEMYRKVGHALSRTKECPYHLEFNGKEGIVKVLFARQEVSKLEVTMVGAVAPIRGSITSALPTFITKH